MKPYKRYEIIEFCCKTVFGGTIPVKRKYSSCRTILGKRMF